MKTTGTSRLTSASQPCPVCGSTARIFHVGASGTITFEGRVAVSVSPTVIPDAQRVFSATSLLLNTVVTLGEKTDEGHVVVAVTLPWYEIIDLLKNDPNVAYKIPSRKWEGIVAGAYERAGFEVTLTPHSADGGRDVIAVRKAGLFVGTVRIIDQVKRYKPGHLVTAEDARALLGVLSADRASSKGFLTTTSDFAPQLRTDPGISPFIPTRLELIDGRQLIQKLITIRDSSRPKLPGSA